MPLKRFSPPYTTTIQSKPEWQRVYIEAESALNRKDYKHALKYFKYLLDHYPHHYEQHEILFKCGIAAEKSGDHKLAKKFITQSFKIKPSEQKLKYLSQLNQMAATT